MNFILLSEKKWHCELFNNLSNQIPGSWKWIQCKKEFNFEELDIFKPDYIFIPHWSYIIPELIYSQFICIVFHMTDLPYGRGGSPLQNLIIRGHKMTKISAIKVDKGIDTGPVYLKMPLSLSGTAEEIFVRASKLIEIMIKSIINGNLVAIEQIGEPVLFVRRSPEDGDIANCENIDQVYDFIRMLDCEGYPNAFLELGKFRLEFNNAIINTDRTIISNVRITEK